MAGQAAGNVQRVEVVAGSNINSARVQQSNRDVLHKQLFPKELTPSDVGKLNRLVIPKNYATKYFPRIDEAMQGGLEKNPAADVQLVFYDENMRPWKFRYCYWKSSQSFVFTRGWNRFVKERLLKANDTVRFFECRNKESFYRITIDRAESSGGIVENANQCVSLSPITLHDKKLEEEINGGHGECRRIKLFGVCVVVDED